MYTFSHAGRDFSTRLDYCKGSFAAPRSLDPVQIQELREFFDTKFSGECRSGGGFFEYLYLHEWGSFKFGKKPKNKNYDVEFELKGAFFADFGMSGLDEFFDWFYVRGYGFIPSRVDCCLDLFEDLSHESKSIWGPRLKGGYRTGLDGAFETAYLGGYESDVRYQLYDKTAERLKRKKIVVGHPWWRFEVTVQKKTLRAQFTELPCIVYSDELWQMAFAFLGMKKKCLLEPDFFQEAVLNVSTGRVKPKKNEKKVSYCESLQWFFSKIRKEFLVYFKGVGHRFPIECEVVVDVTPAGVYDALNRWEEMSSIPPSVL